jgi:hypothetical protein
VDVVISRLAPWLALFSLLGLLAADAAAQARVRDLRLLGAPDAVTPQTRFPAGTRTIYAAFDYEDADGVEIGLLVTARGALSAFSFARPFSGSGTERVPIDGTAVSRSLAGELRASVEAARAEARQAAGQSFGVQEHLLASRGSLMRAGYSCEVLGGGDLGDEPSALLAAVEADCDRAAGLAVEALGLPPDDIPGKRALAARMDEPLANALTGAASLVARVGELPELPIPASGPDPRNAYTVRLRVDGTTVEGIDFHVVRHPRLYLPLTARGHDMGRR